MTNDLATDNAYKQHINRLQNEVNRSFGKTVSSTTDFEKLSEKTRLSTQTLRRFFGKIDKEKQLSITSLDLICNYIGFADWQSFCNNTTPATPTQLREVINSFYDTIAFSGASFFDVKLRDTHEAYAPIILNDLPYAYSFLERYKNTPKITQSLYPWFPYYDYMAQASYVHLIETYLATQPLEHLRVCQNYFLAYGVFCSAKWGDGADSVKKYTTEADKYIESVWRDYPDSFFHYPETRYTIAKVVLAYLNNNEQEAIRVAEAALHRNLRAKPLHVFDEEFNTPDILISKLCNALIWMGKVDFAIEIYSTFSEELFLTKDPVENMSQRFVYERDTQFAAQTVDMLRLFDPSIPELVSKRQPHWKTRVYEEIQQLLIDLKRCKKGELSKRLTLKERLRTLAKQTNFGVIENLIQLFQ